MAIITLTDAAAAHIINVIKKRGHGIGFRISVKQTGCSGYMYVPEIIDVKKPTDIELSIIDGLTVFVDPECRSIIDGTVLDYVKKDLGMEQLQFNNPNAVGLCGCGESFKLKDEKHD